MKKLGSIILKIIFIGFSLFYSLISFLFYFIGAEDMRGNVIRDQSNLVGGIIALIFALIIFPIGINLIMNTGKTRHKAKRLLSVMTGKEYERNELVSDGLRFDNLGTLGKADSLVPRAYMKPMSIIVGTLFFFTTLILPLNHLFTSGLELNYIISQTIVSLIFKSPFVIIIIVLNVRFYPWVKMWAMNLESLNEIFPTSEGLIKTFMSNAKTVKEKYEQAPMDIHIIYSDFNNYNNNRTFKREEYYKKDTKRHERSKEVVKQGIIYTQLRHGICLLLWLSSFILGWFVLPRLVTKIKTTNNIKVIKHFYPNKSMEGVLEDTEKSFFSNKK